MDLLESFVSDNELSIDNVRSLIDDYSLISYYLGYELELGPRYSSPLREGDEDPSFSLFYGYNEGKKDKLHFKDHATGEYGDVFDFLKLFFGAETTIDILNKINTDLQLGFGTYVDSKLEPTIIRKTPVVAEKPKLAQTSQYPTKEFMDYWWNKYEITRTFTNMYFVKCVKVMHLVYSDITKVIVPKSLCISYSIGNYIKFYQPLGSKDLKFRNNFPPNFIEGHMQLDWSRNDLLVITKAMKECILFRCHWNIQAVAGKSETTMIHPYFMSMYLSHFKRVLLWLDPDPAGIEATKKYLSLYPNLEVATVPKGITEKDPTDMYEVYRNQKTTEIIKKALHL